MGYCVLSFATQNPRDC